MQEELNDFDLRMRSMLEDAEAKPSRRVWKGISSRLDSSSAAAREYRPERTRLAWASLAFAAALGLGIFFVGTMPQTSPVESGAMVALLSEKDVAWVAEERLPKARPLNTTGTVRMAADYTVSAEAPSESLGEDKAAADDGQETVAAGNPAKNNGTTSRWKSFASKGARGRDDSRQDEFAQLDMEDARRSGSRKTALYLKGAIGGNDSEIHVSGPHTVMAPGYGTSGISELSTSTYGVPFTLGLGLRVYVLPKLSVGTGLDYSLLTRTFTGKYVSYGSNGELERSEAGDVLHALHYIGIPVGLYYDVLDYDNVKFYVYGLGEAEYCISSRYTLFSTPDIHCSDKVEKLQYSAGIGLGLEFRLSRLLGLYLDPGLRYYFPCDQPKSVRTDKPVVVNFDAGLRFNF